MNHKLKRKWAEYLTKDVPDCCMCGNEIGPNRYCDNHSPVSCRDYAISGIMERNMNYKDVPAIGWIILAASIIGLTVIGYLVFR